jgi:hypothetical protein
MFSKDFVRLCKRSKEYDVWEYDAFVSDCDPEICLVIQWQTFGLTLESQNQTPHLWSWKKEGNGMESKENRY